MTLEFHFGSFWRDEGPRLILVPEVLFVEGELVLFEELAKFVLEGFRAVMFALVLDVGGDGIEI